MKKIFLCLILLYSIGSLKAQDLPSSGFAKKKAADKEKKAFKQKQILKKNLPIYGLFSSRLNRISPDKIINFTPVISHNHLFIPLKGTIYYQNLPLDIFPKPTFFLRPN